jgi:ribonuclease Z
MGAVNRELIVLGTASQVPTRERAHNGYLLRWDDQGILFDPGEGSQRQLLLAGASASDITRICITHFHGDHCLGLPGIIQRMSLDGLATEVPAHFPVSGIEYFERLRHASVFYDRAPVVPEPVKGDERIEAGPFTLTTRRLRHPVDAVGYRLEEPDGRRMLPDRLVAHGIAGPAVGQLIRDGYLDAPDGRVEIDDVSEFRRGQVVAFIMDTGICDAVGELAQGADLLVIESTFLEPETQLAAEAGHLTAAQAGQIARDAGARRLVLTHFSQRYPETEPFVAEAAHYFNGEIVAAQDLARIAVPPR